MYMTLSQAKKQLHDLMEQYLEGLISLAELRLKALDVLNAVEAAGIFKLIEVIG